MKKGEKIAFEQKDLEQFLTSTNLILKSNALSRIKGGGLYLKYIFENYCEKTFVNYA